MPDAPVSLIPRLSGSDRRQRIHVVGVRLLASEYASLRTRAAEAGLRVGSYLRACALGDAGPRARRSPTVNAQQLAIAIAQLNRVGNNLNQIAHALNAARTVDARDTVSTLQELRDVLTQIKAALGRSGHDDP